MIFLVLFAALLLPNSVLSKFESKGVELVYTAPLDTELQTNDLRNPAEVWAELFDQAQKSIDIGHMYAISENGSTLENVIESLERAGNRGVKIRMLLETKMQIASKPATIERLKKIKNLTLRMMEFGKTGHGGIIHAKFLVIDSKRAFVGSQNWDYRSLEHVHEVGVLFREKKLVSQLQRIFNMDWVAQAALAKNRKPVGYRKKEPAPSKDSLYLVASPPDFCLQT